MKDMLANNRVKTDFLMIGLKYEYASPGHEKSFITSRPDLTLTDTLQVFYTPIHRLVKEFVTCRTRMSVFSFSFK